MSIGRRAVSLPSVCGAFGKVKGCVCVCDPSGVTRFLFTFFAVLLAGGSWTHGLELLAPSPFEDLEAP